MTALLLGEAPRFRTILMDPPWPERGGGQVKRGADRHYDLLDQPGARTVPAILRVVRACPLWRPFPDASHLWMWCTDNYLPAGLWLIEQLGFDYKRTFVWAKSSLHPAVDGDGAAAEEPPEDGDLRGGIGQYGRGAHELLLFATCGAGMSPLVYSGDRAIKSLFTATHERDAGGKVVHSRKPLRSYELIERRSKGPYAEIFGRRQLPGWEAWGNEIEGAELAGAPEPSQGSLFGGTP